MAATEVYRYFWMRATNQEGREINSVEEMRFMRSLASRALETPQGSAQWDALAEDREQARWFLGPTADNATRVTIVDASATLALQIIPGADHAVSEGGVEIDLLSMPPAWSQRAAADWIKGPVGQVWSRGAMACRFGYSVVSGSARKEG